MSSVMSAAATVIEVGNASQLTQVDGGLLSGDPLVSLIMLTVVLLIWYAELRRRCGSIDLSTGMPDCSKVLRLCAPEVAGLFACFVLVACLRFFGEYQVPQAVDELVTHENEVAWDEIRKSWPILMCADSLLSVQAMLRLVLFASAALRPSIGTELFCGEPAAILLAAGICRAGLLISSGSHVLDGPLGGCVNSAFEVCTLVPLLSLSRPALRRSPVKLGAVALVAWRMALNNRLVLAGDATIDTAFHLMHFLELFSSVAFLIKYMADMGERRSSAVASFVHLLLPMQQGLSAYYFVQEFAFVPEMVDCGYPFEVMYIGTGLQLVVYLLVAALYFVMHDDEKDV